MWSLSLVMSECSLSGRGQGHVSNFYIVDFKNFATASRRYTGDIHNSTVVGLFMTPETMGRVMVQCTLFMTHCLRLNLQLHTISLVRTCRISSFCTVAWQLARLLLTRCIAGHSAIAELLVILVIYFGWLSSRELLACWTQAQKGPGSNRSRDSVGNSLRQTVHTHCSSVHQAAKIGSSPLNGCGGNCRLWRKVMAAYRRVYDLHDMQADCQELRSAPEPFAW